jgi:putative two-component system response regulator
MEDHQLGGLAGASGFDWAAHYARASGEVDAILTRSISQAELADVVNRVEALCMDLRQGPKDVDRVNRVEALRKSAFWFYGQASASSRAIPIIEDAVLMAQDVAKADVTKRELLRLTHTTAGIVLTDSLDIGRAMDHYATAMQLADEDHNALGLASAYLNTAVALMYAALFSDSITCFERAIKFAKDPSIKPEFAAQALSAAYTNIGKCYFSLNRLDDGIKAVKEGVSWSEIRASYPFGDDATGRQAAQAAAHSRVITEYAYTLLLIAKLNQSNISEQERLLLLSEIRERTVLVATFTESYMNVPRIALIARSCEGLLALVEMRIDEGLAILTGTLERAKVTRAAMDVTLEALTLGCEVGGRPDLAVKYQEELIEAKNAKQRSMALARNKEHLARLVERVPAPGPTGLMDAHRLAVLRRKTAERSLFQQRNEYLLRLAVTAELRDDPSGTHVYRVGRLAALLGAELGLDTATCDQIDLAARLHDIGKVGVSDRIILKAGPLTPEETEMMQAHVIVGAELLSKSEMPEIQMAERIARHHHQHWDGTGYPKGAKALKGKDIPLEARITTIADVYDTLTHFRVYKGTFEPEEALEMLSEQSGKIFDPNLVEHFVPMMRRLMQEHPELDTYLSAVATSSALMQTRMNLSSFLKRHGDDEIEESPSPPVH